MDDFYRRLKSVGFMQIAENPGRCPSERYLLDAGPHLCLISIHKNSKNASIRLRAFQSPEYNGTFDGKFNPLDEDANRIIEYIEARERKLIRESAFRP